ASHQGQDLYWVVECMAGSEEDFVTRLGEISRDYWDKEEHGEHMPETVVMLCENCGKETPAEEENMPVKTKKPRARRRKPSRSGFVLGGGMYG
ncbi:MAG: hypothetical protein HOM14_07055, partial [Gammaproteobacteria bacterium]|nr:hypothetical protein [Gammaproteobacteria bacterium]